MLVQGGEAHRIPDTVPTSICLRTWLLSCRSQCSHTGGFAGNAVRHGPLKQPATGFVLRGWYMKPPVSVSKRRHTLDNAPI